MGLHCIVGNASGRVEVAKELFRLADFVIFPVQASEDDLTAAPVTVQALKTVGVLFLFVLTRVNANTLIMAQAAAVLSRHGQVAGTFVGDRTAYESPTPRVNPSPRRNRRVSPKGDGRLVDYRSIMPA
jgi:hypothetical protein